jgi:allantoin racemase
MTIRVRVVTPITTRDERTHALARELCSPGVQIDVVEISKGPAFIETADDEARAEPDTVRQIVEAERAGVHAAVIDCMGDPGLEAARKAVSIPAKHGCAAGRARRASWSFRTTRFGIVNRRAGTRARDEHGARSGAAVRARPSRRA